MTNAEHMQVNDTWFKALFDFYTKNNMANPLFMFIGIVCLNGRRELSHSHDTQEL